MENDESLEYLIRIEFDEFITRLDLDEVLSAIDRLIEEELIYDIYPDIHIFFSWRKLGYLPWMLGIKRPLFSYIGIRSVESGSIKLSVIIGGAVLRYFGKRFMKGVDESNLADEIIRSGRITGDLMEKILKRVNDWAEPYVKKQQQHGGHISKITIEKKSIKKPSEGEASQ